MKTLLLFALVLLTVSVRAAEPPALPARSALQIIKAEKQFAFSDGSSYFLFKADGAFESGPLGMSGRTISGRWTVQDNVRFVVEGRWGWVNGTSAEDDFRRMTLSVQSPTLDTAPQSAALSGGPEKLYRCYFVIDDVVKIPKPFVDRASAEKQIRAFYAEAVRLQNARDFKALADLLEVNFSPDWTATDEAKRLHSRDLEIRTQRNAIAPDPSVSYAIVVKAVFLADATATVNIVQKRSRPGAGAGGTLTETVVSPSTDTWVRTNETWHLAKSVSQASSVTRTRTQKGVVPPPQRGN